MTAWERECKGQYYLRTQTSQRAENVAEKVELDKLVDYKNTEEDDCVSCQG